MEKLNISVEEITPAKAAEMLRLNTRNRTIRLPRVASYARDMLAGLWNLNGEPIQLCGNILLNGQHRLLACVKAGVPFTTVVIRGLSSDIHPSIDTGAPRSFADELRWLGESSSTILASSLRLVWAYDNGAILDGRLVPTRQEMLAILDSQPTIRESLAVASTAFDAVRMPASVISSTHYLFSRETTPEEATAFWYLVRTEGAADPNTGPFVLRRYALRVAIERRVRPLQSEWMALTIKAFNHWMAGASLSHLRWRRGGVKSEAFPSITPDAFIGEADPSKEW